MAELKKAGADVRAFERQVIVTIWSKFLVGESMAFNPLRAKRFRAAHAHRMREGTSYPTALSSLRGLQCGGPSSSDFCSPYNLTMADERVGYLSSSGAVAFANMGRLSALHGVVASRQFEHPLELTRRSVADMFALCFRWFGRMRRAYPEKARYPSLTFDLLRNGGVSSMHNVFPPTP